MGRMGHIAGKGVSKQHSTVIEAALPVVKFLQKVSEVSNISLGRLDVHLPTTGWRIKITEMRGGMKLQVRGTSSIQQLMIYTTDLSGVQEKLVKEFSGKFQIIL